MITVTDYFGPKDKDPEATEQMRESAGIMLGKVNDLLDEAIEAGVYTEPVCPFTGTCVSGSHIVPPTGDGGFRDSRSVTGGPSSAHRKARAVDVYDPLNPLDNWITTFDYNGGAGNTLLEKHGLYREAPTSTSGWCHLQDVSPGSGRRTFQP